MNYFSLKIASNSFIYTPCFRSRCIYPPI